MAAGTSCFVMVIRYSLMTRSSSFGRCVLASMCQLCPLYYLSDWFKISLTEDYQVMALK